MNVSLKGTFFLGICLVPAIGCWFYVTQSRPYFLTLPRPQQQQSRKAADPSGPNPTINKAVIHTNTLIPLKTKNSSKPIIITATDGPTNATKRWRYYKTFAYLTMTESCLSNSLRSRQQIGDPTSCQCDVLVLSWKKKCSDSSLPHVEYLFDPKTSWTTGRNLLYRTVMKREQRYRYYTFFDDDIKLVFYKEKPQGNVSPWREYERALLKLGPAVGVAWDTDKRHFKKYYDGNCNYPSKTDFLPLTWYNALFNSFHSEVIEYLLPYYDKMEKTSIWYSQVYMIMKCDLMFQPGQVLHHVNIFAENPLHRPYTRKMHDSSTVRGFLNDLKSEIPTKYHKQLEPRLQDWVKNVNKKEEVKYHCPYFPEVRRPFVPYLYLDNQTQSR